MAKKDAIRRLNSARWKLDQGLPDTIVTQALIAAAWALPYSANYGDAFEYISSAIWTAASGDEHPTRMWIKDALSEIE